MEGAEHHPATTLLGPPGDTAHVSEVAGHEREHARGEERHESRRERERDGQPQAAVSDHVAHHDSASTSSRMSASVVEEGSNPEMRAATRPSASSTSVVGTADGGTSPANALSTSRVLTSRIES